MQRRFLASCAPAVVTSFLPLLPCNDFSSCSRLGRLCEMPRATYPKYEQAQLVRVGWHSLYQSHLDHTKYKARRTTFLHSSLLSKSQKNLCFPSYFDRLISSRCADHCPLPVSMRIFVDSVFSRPAHPHGFHRLSSVVSSNVSRECRPRASKPRRDIQYELKSGSSGRATVIATNGLSGIPIARVTRFSVCLASTIP